MGIIYTVLYEQSVIERDIATVPTNWKQKIKNTISQKLTTNPEVFGKPLRRSLKGYRRLRVGDYRVVYRIEDQTVKVFAILHRSIVYKIIEKRI